MEEEEVNTEDTKAKAPALALRTCKADMTSYGGFKWPESGRVEAPDWDAKPECGNGLHGLLWGEGVGDLLNWDEDAKWLVVAVEGETVDLGGKVKFRAGEVVYCGDRKGATDYIIANGATGHVVGAFVTTGDYGTATAGDCGTATAGNCGTATAGDYGTVAVRWHDGNRYRLAVGYVGEDGILRNVPYVVRDGKLVRADGEDSK